MTKESNLFGLQLQSQLQAILFFTFVVYQKSSFTCGLPQRSSAMGLNSPPDALCVKILYLKPVNKSSYTISKTKDVEVDKQAQFKPTEL